MSLLPGFAPTAAEARAMETDTADRQDDPTPRLPARVESKIDRAGAGGCWLWTGRTQKGYGIITMGGKPKRAHRVVFAALVGQIDEGHHVHHECHVRHCVNPEHLAQHDPLSHAQEHAATRTMCAHGHPLSGENLYHEPGGKRRCRACARARDRRHYLRHRDPATPPPKAARTHCPKGHPYAGANLYVDPKGHRFCRTCKRDRDRARRAAR